MKRKYEICNVGCHDETDAYFVLSKEEYEFLKRIFDELNEHSRYGCMPTIHIHEIEDTE